MKGLLSGIRTYVATMLVREPTEEEFSDVLLKLLIHRDGLLRKQ